MSCTSRPMSCRLEGLSCTRGPMSCHPHFTGNTVSSRARRALAPPAVSSRARRATRPDESRDLNVDGVGGGSRLIVEDVLLQSIRLEARERRGGVKLTIVPSFYVRPSHDKWIRMNLRVLAPDGTFLGEATKDRIDAEEEKLKQARQTVRFEADEPGRVTLVVELSVTE